MGRIKNRFALKAGDFINSVKFPWGRWAKTHCLYSGVVFKDAASVRFLGRCRLMLSHDSTVRIGKGFVCRSGVEYAMDTFPSSKIVVSSGAELSIGDFTEMSNTVIYCKSSVSIGSHVKIGSGCIIMDSDFHSTDWSVRQSEYDVEQAKISPVSIGDDVFIGARTIICKGISIGSRTIIGAGSVVTKSIPEDCLAGGNPCVVIKRL